MGEFRYFYLAVNFTEKSEYILIFIEGNWMDTADTGVHGKLSPQPLTNPRDNFLS